jgi:hypothetical protein
VTTALEAAEEWLWEDGDNVEVKVYTAKKDELKKLVGDIFYRYDQIEKRTAAIKSFKESVEDARKRSAEWVVREEKRIAKNESTWIHKNDTDKLIKMCDDADLWLKDNEAELEKAGLLVKPPFSAAEVGQYVRPLESEVSYLRYKPKPKSKKPKKAANKSNSTGNASNASNTSNASSASTNTSDSETKSDDVGHEDL